MSFSTAIQQAVYDRLRTYAPLTAVLAPHADSNIGGSAVYDDVPQSAEFPYVALGDDTLIEWDTDTELGAEATITLHTWSRERGRRETKLIQGLLYDALHRYELPIPGMHVIDCLWEMSESFLDPDGHTRHGVSRFRVIMQRL